MKTIKENMKQIKTDDKVGKKYNFPFLAQRSQSHVEKITILFLTEKTSEGNRQQTFNHQTLHNIHILFQPHTKLQEI